MIYFSTGDPYFGQIKIYARGNLSIDEINKLQAMLKLLLMNILALKIIFFKPVNSAMWLLVEAEALKI